MSKWRFRISLPGDPHGLAVLTDVLASQPVSRLRIASRNANASASASATTMTSEIVVDLWDDDGLGGVLCALHDISPQVFVSRETGPERVPETA